MENVMTEIERQTRYLFGSDKDVDLSVKVTVDVDNEPLSTALDQMVRGTGISYDIKDSYILLSKTAARSDKLKLVRGKVTDQNGDPLVGAMVYSKTDMTRSSVTDLDGNFSLEVPSDDVIMVSLLGFKDMEIPASSATANMSIPMQQDISTLDEVVVVGYGVQKKVNVTGAVSQIKADEMSDRPVLKMTQALQGQVPNLNITFSSGQPGKSSSIDIRGTGSINGGEPLILIDGIPGSLDNINVNDVESISVLKDASASAVYGARAAFGVILVTTKSAEEGTVNVDYQGSFGVSTHAVCTDFVTDAWTNSRINDQAFFNSKGTHLFNYSDEQWNELYIRRNDKVENPERPWVVVTNVNGKDRYNYYGNFDWFNYLYKRFRPKTSHSLSVSGTQKKVKYLISGNYSDEQGIFRISPDRYNQYGMMVKVGADVTKWLTISNTTRFYKTSYNWTGYNQSYTPDNEYPIGSSDAQFYSPYYHYHPQYVPVNPDGTLTGNSEMSNYTMGFGLHAIQLDEVLYHAVFLVLKHSFFSTDRYHGRHFFAADGCLMLGGRHQFGYQLGQPHQRIGNDNHGTDDASRRNSQRTPVVGTHAFGKDFGKNQNKYGEYGRDDTKISFAKHFHGFGTYTCRTYGVGYGIERKDSGNGFVNVLLQLLEQGGRLESGLFLHGDEGHGGGQKDCFHNGAEKRY